MRDFTVLVLESAYPTSVAATLGILGAAKTLAPRLGLAPPSWQVFSMDGGVIDLRGPHDDALARAQDQMRDQCGSDRYTITEETSETQSAVTSSSGTVQVTLWHFRYQCTPGR